jgi:hypothetical protein
MTGDSLSLQTDPKEKKNNGVSFLKGWEIQQHEFPKGKIIQFSVFFKVTNHSC